MRNSERDWRPLCLALATSTSGHAASDGAAMRVDSWRWAVPGSNGRPPACKARAAAAVHCRLSLETLGEG